MSNTDEEINKMWYTHNWISIIFKMKEILAYTTWMNPEEIMLSEKSLSQKDKCYMSLLIWGI